MQPGSAPGCIPDHAGWQVQVCGAEPAICICAVAARRHHYGEVCVHVRARPHLAEAHAQPHAWPEASSLPVLLHRALQGRVSAHHTEVHRAPYTQAGRADCTHRFAYKPLQNLSATWLQMSALKHASFICACLTFLSFCHCSWIFRLPAAVHTALVPLRLSFWA